MPGNKYCQCNIEFQPRETRSVDDRGINVIFNNFRFSLHSYTIFSTPLRAEIAITLVVFVFTLIPFYATLEIFISSQRGISFTFTIHRTHPMTIRNLYGTFHGTPIGIPTDLLYRPTDWSENPFDASFYRDCKILAISLNSVTKIETKIP